ncbi:hypothetical protein FV139_07425 [Parahaliea maris]|uniref:SPOR domain-containing protein n=1 Tax=Parahaliea maris TaxID=2716870 RepID=A0A5C9A8Y9_9GAMM|nr:SPOR domain-containing protein [Parahaliea maris]TXS95691.1 hypothetical protein FV139_07425 [Parahaliea maris]
MNNVLKQRLVGALILVALGVVFWPIIFVEPESARQAPVVRMPPPPAIDTTPLASPDKVGLRGSPPLDADDGLAEPNLPAAPDANAVSVLVADAEPEAPEAEPAPAITPPDDKAIAARAREERPAQPEIDDQGIPVAWTLQVISVSRKEGADQTLQRLQAMGHKAYVKVAEVEGRKVFRVYVGPKFERARLDDIKADVDRQFGVKSMVRRYYP